MTPFVPLTEPDYPLLDQSLTDHSWIVACFCAQWCGACRGWRPAFEDLASRYPDMVFLWIDIEDHAELLGELDIENFPTLLIQYGDIVNFFGCIHPDAGVAQRLIQNQLDMPPDEMKRLATSNAERAAWQREANLRTLLHRLVASGA